MRSLRFNSPHKKGAALVYVIITFLVLIILTSIILTIGSSESRFSLNDADRARAYYIARSGAEAFAQNASENSTLSDTSEISFGSGTFKITVDSSNPDKPVITSTGKYHRSERTLKLSLIPKSLFPTAVFAYHQLDMANNSSLTGDVEIASGGILSDPKNNIDGSITLNSTKTFPDIPLHYDTSTAADYSSGIINGSVPVYKNISLGSRSLEIQTGGNRVEVDANSLSGNNCNVYVHGKGTFILHLNSLYFKGNLISDPDTATIIVIAPAGTAQAEFQTGSSDFQAYIYGPSAEVTIKANMTFSGAIIADEINIQSGGSLQFTGDASVIDPSILNLERRGYTKNRWED